MSEEQLVPFIGVSRHRMATDGNGVTTLAAFHGCRLGCRYCLNPQCRVEDMQCLWHSPETLYEKIRADELYFLATGGGITFGGGEPLLYPDFIVRFREICGPQWKINVETSLNVAAANVEAIADVVDAWFIDVKDIDADLSAGLLTASAQSNGGAGQGCGSFHASCQPAAMSSCNPAVEDVDTIKVMHNSGKAEPRLSENEEDRQVFGAINEVMNPEMHRCKIQHTDNVRP